MEFEITDTVASNDPDFQLDSLGIHTDNMLVVVATNKSSAPQTVTVEITPENSSDDCEGEPFIVEVVVNPEPVGQPKDTTLCSGLPVNFDLNLGITNGLAIDSFTWSGIDIGLSLIHISEPTRP